MSDIDPMFTVRDGTLHTMTPEPYGDEGVLQTLVADFPEVIGRVQTVTDGEPPRVALVRREFSIGDTGSGTFWLDHLMLDADGVPIFIETKRSSDTRIRREVIGQVLDYVAHAAVNVPVQKLQEQIERSITDDPELDDVDAWLRERLGREDPATFWNTVETNLRDGRVRILIVADAIPANTARIIEFLNEKLDGVDVLGIELPQYVSDDGARVLAPRVIGRTSRAVDAKRRDSWDEARFFEWTDRTNDGRAKAVAERLLAHVRSAGGEARFGAGQRPSVTGRYGEAEATVPVWQLVLNETPDRSYLVLYVTIVGRDIGAPAAAGLLDVLRGVPAWSWRLDEWDSDEVTKKSLSMYLNEFPDEGQHVEQALVHVVAGGHA